MEHVYSELNLDSDEVVEVPHMAPGAYLPADHRHRQDDWELQGVPIRRLWTCSAPMRSTWGRRGVNMFATCTPYQVGNVPVKGEHCAWMELSAVIYCNSVLVRTNSQGKESTGAAALTGRIPYWGFHIT